jgi:hypothetical protein
MVVYTSPWATKNKPREIFETVPAFGAKRVFWDETMRRREVVRW